jgi:hypothetical protein
MARQANDDRSLGEILRDQEWIKIKKETAEINGPLVGEVQDRTLYLTDYSPRKTLAK